MKLTILLVKSEGTTKNMKVAASAPKVISLRTLLQGRRMEQSSLNMRDLTLHNVKS